MCGQPEKWIRIKGRQAHMHQNLLNAECASVEYLNAKNKNVQVIRVMQALTKVLLKCFCCTYACRQCIFWATCNTLWPSWEFSVLYQAVACRGPNYFPESFLNSWREGRQPVGRGHWLPRRATNTLSSSLRIRNKYEEMMKEMWIYYEDDLFIVK